MASAVQESDSKLPVRKRQLDNEESATVGGEPESKVLKKDHDVVDTTKKFQGGVSTKARSIRLEQNRKAARESRRRKKVMIEELQRSVIFFSRANGTLKQQNDELTRLLMQAQVQVAAIETSRNAPAATTPTAAAAPPPPKESEPTPAPTPAATLPTSASAAALSGSLPPMQPGATMQAMANFQQAATAAMQAAVQGMKGTIPGVSLQTLAAPTVAGASNPQQAYNDTMTALAMQVTATGGNNTAYQPFVPTTETQEI
jgi:hypothetical protein